MNGATYMADLTGGQKTGLFYDQRPNHAFAAKLVHPGAQVLDVFSHVGGFGLAMLAGGASAGTCPSMDLQRRWSWQPTAPMRQDFLTASKPDKAMRSRF